MVIIRGFVHTSVFMGIFNQMQKFCVWKMFTFNFTNKTTKCVHVEVDVLSWADWLFVHDNHDFLRKFIAILHV